MCSDRQGVSGWLGAGSYLYGVVAGFHGGGEGRACHHVGTLGAEPLGLAASAHWPCGPSPGLASASRQWDAGGGGGWGVRATLWDS